MFDPHRLVSRNRHIQKRAQILQPKGTFTTPVEAITRKDLEEYQRILIANKIPAYMPPSDFPIPISHIFYRADGGYDVLETIAEFTYSSGESSIVAVGWYLIFSINEVTNSMNIMYAQVTSSTPITLPANSYYIQTTQASGPTSMIQIYGPGDSQVDMILEVPVVVSSSAANIDITVPLTFMTINLHHP